VNIAPAPEVKVLCVIIYLNGFSIRKSELVDKDEQSWPSRLREQSPSVACQLFISTVASKIDYAAFRCCLIRLNTAVTAEIEQPFEIIQRVALQATAGGSPNAALVINEGQTRTEATVVRH
jgi:hypothetical protein